MALSEQVRASIVARFTRPDFDRWQRQLDELGGCAHPVRLAGSIASADGAVVYDSAAEPDGVLYKRCGNRRRSRCPSCSFLYKGDQFIVSRAGMVGGEHVPASVADHPMLWVTLTAPSFGSVHTVKGGPCHPAGAPGGKSGRTTGARCPHGLPAFCLRRHCADDPQVAQPLCPRCYDHRAAVLFNWHAGELWRRFRIDVDRQLAQALGYTAAELGALVRVEFYKVAELQARAVVHFHAVIRLDEAGHEPGVHQPPSISIPTTIFEQAVRAAAANVRLTVPAGPDVGQVLRLGRQIDVQPISASDLDGQGPAAMAAYLAKYTTKSSEDFGVGARPITATEARRRRVSAHVVAMVEAAGELARSVRAAEAGVKGLARLERFTHQFGYHGHFATKSRRYSFTLGHLQRKRVAYRRAQWAEVNGLVDDVDVERGVEGETVAEWHYEGSGWLSQGDAALAASSAARAREWRQHQAEQRRESQRSNVKV